MYRQFLQLFAATIFSVTAASAQKTYQVLTVPGKDAYTHIDARSRSVLPSGRYVTPAGTTITITHDPFGMAVSPDGATTVTL
ncbi:MAG: hypothetical protein JST42_28660, partial [Bacteroidetes bacterium]|nr:hypothetical protein [Bacteroidota bacterium]